MTLIVTLFNKVRASVTVFNVSTSGSQDNGTENQLAFEFQVHLFLDIL